MNATAAQMPDVPFKVAGDGPVLREMKAKAPQNVEFVGRLGPKELGEFYQRSRMLVVPSVWFEQFPMVVLEAMGRALPVIGSRIGGLPSIIEEGRTGSLFEPGNAENLVQQVRRLWEDPQLCRRMGDAGRQKALREYTEETYFRNLMAVYQTAIQRSRTGVGLIPISSLGTGRARPASASS
jgi:glycosyltransferase involved in cell wall biosynthesis